MSLSTFCSNSIMFGKTTGEEVASELSEIMDER